MMQPVIIRRRKKHEAEQAVADLIKRGFVVTYPLTEQKYDGKVFTTDSYSRKIFQNNTYSSSWIAKLERRVVSG